MTWLRRRKLLGAFLAPSKEDSCFQPIKERRWQVQLRARSTFKPLKHKVKKRNILNFVSIFDINNYVAWSMSRYFLPSSHSVEHTLFLRIIWKNNPNSQKTNQVTWQLLCNKLMITLQDLLVSGLPIKGNTSKVLQHFVLQRSPLL